MMTNNYSDIISSFDPQIFRARLHFDLRHNRVDSENWEQIIADCTNSEWIKGSTYLADVVNHEKKCCISVKTRQIKPTINKTKASRDFITHPGSYHKGGHKITEGDLDNIHTVSRRCSIPNLDEQRSALEDIGQAAIEDYHAFEQASLTHFRCERTLDIVVLHGMSADEQRYLSRVMFFSHNLNDIQSWDEIVGGKGSKFKGKRMMIVGYDQNGPHIGRNSNLGRQQTCMFRFYRKSEAIQIMDFQIPMPDQEQFDLARELEMMK